MPIDFAVRGVGAGKDELYIALLHNVTRSFARAGFQPGLRHGFEAKGFIVEVGRLLGVTHVKLDVVISLNGKKVFTHGITLPYLHRLYIAVQCPGEAGRESDGFPSNTHEIYHTHHDLTTIDPHRHRP